MNPLGVDCLKVFVSSTIKECAAERKAVKNAILSVNHEPVLFEDIGARSHPPQALYRARLEISHIFIGIYRESYGWIAPDMQISGLEDEFRLAADQAKDRLVYIFETPSCRDPKLQGLIDEAKNAGITVASYTDPLQLTDQVRNDLTGVISSRFVDQAVALHDAPQPYQILDSLVPDPGHRLRRPAVEAALVATLQKVGRLLLTGPMGGGKTVLLAQLALDKGWLFVDAQGLSPLDLLAQAANAFRHRLGQEAITLTTKASAVRELLRNWERLPESVLVVDGASDPLVLWEIPPVHRKLVLSSRSPLGVSAEQRFDLPALSDPEVAEWITAFQGQPHNPAELAELVYRSRGNPLYLRFFALHGDSSVDRSLRELETRALKDLPPKARELTSYLALSPRGLSLADLHILVGSEEGVEAVAEQVTTAIGLLRQLGDQVLLVHDHLRATTLDQLHQNPARLAFFASRLGTFYEDTQRHLAAFQVYREAGQTTHTDRVLPRAANQAVMMGGGAPAIPVLRRQAELAQARGAFEEQLHALLYLASALRQTGAIEDASSALNDARATAQRLNEPSQLLWVREVEAALNIDGRPRGERIAELIALRHAFTENDDLFSAARTGLLLTSEYLSGGDYDEAEMTSRQALKVFTELGDEHGARVTKLNLAAALSEIGGRKEEAESIVQELQQQLVPEEHPRERASLCNYLTRHYRIAGDPTQAAQFALEAIRIGEQLGDRYVVAINRINLGNVRRDEGDYDQAHIEYTAAELVAAEAGLPDEEAVANELIASVHNLRGEHGDALYRAEYATSLARLSGNHFLASRAEEERAIALKGQGDLEGAIGAYGAGATQIAQVRPGGPFYVSLLVDALKLCAESRRGDLQIELLKAVFLSDDPEIDQLYVLCRALPAMTDVIGQVDRLLQVVALSMAEVLGNMPPLVERRVILQTSATVSKHCSSSSDDYRLAAVASILMVQSGSSIALGDLVHIAEGLAESSARISFKPQSDGTGHWTLRLQVGEGVLVTLAQMDDDPRTATTTAVLALLLAGLDRVIRQELLDLSQLPRQEGTIYVTTSQHMDTKIDPEVSNFGDMPSGFIVTESVDVTQGDQPPIWVICDGEFPRPWCPHERPLSGFHLLLAELLRVLVGHLLARAVEHEVLLPKVSRVVRKIGISH